MKESAEQRELRCPACDAVELCGLTQMLTRLRAAGLFRRTPDPCADEVVELLQESASRLRCAQCQNTGLEVRPVEDEDWDDERCCESCGQPIPWERLELFPQASHCTSCQVREEAGQEEEADYCPRCGSVMQMRTQSGHGPTRYVMTCPQCGR